MKCPLCHLELEPREDLFFNCPTKVPGRKDSHYQYQSKLTWSAETLIVPPFWLKTAKQTTFVYKYPFYPEREIQTQPDFTNLIIKVPRIDYNNLEKHLHRIKLLLVFL